nr:Ls-TLR3 [Cyclina sinensis]
MDVNLRLILYLILINVCLKIASACDSTVRNVISGNKPNCGEQQCFCVDRSAYCVGNKTLTALPKFHTQISELYAECYDFSNLNSSSLKNVIELNLHTLRFRRNDIQKISKDIFRDFQQIRVMEISENINLNKTLLLWALKGLNKSNIESLSLQGNRIKKLNLQVFEEFTSLTKLTLSDNRIKSIKGRNKLQYLKELDLARNILRGKTSIQFCLNGNVKLPRFPNLEKLDLSRNTLGRNGNPLKFNWTCLNKLTVLDLSNNTLSEVSFSLFESLKSLNYLNLASNWIQRVNVGIYPPLLESINFFDNYLTGQPPPLCLNVRGNKTFPNLKHLFFGRNNLQRLDTRWNCLPGIETLDFSKNDVRIISNHTFSNFKNLKTLDLRNMISWNKRIDVEAFNSASLQNLDIRFDMIDFSKPKNRYLFSFSPNLTWLEISYNNFTGVSVESIKDILSPLRKLKTLIMQGIHLKTFPVEILENLTQLIMLDIENNELHSIEFPRSFNDTSKELRIRNISVARSLINTITVKAFPTAIIKSLKYLDLSDNQFLCDCDMEWFRNNINSTGYVRNVRLLNWPDKYLCRSPTSLNGHLFQTFQPDQICKPLDPVIVAVIAIVSFLFVFSISASVIYWKRWYITFWWYKMTRRSKDGKYTDLERMPILDHIQYDGYIVSNHKDNDFVHHPFRELIENKLGYKLHIWERDSKNGALVDVMLDAIYASRHVLVIVSNNLIRDSWCKFQIDVAIDRSIELNRNCITLVVLEDVDFKAVSRAWCVMLTKMPTAYWSNDKESIKQKLFEETINRQLGLRMIE